jgi:hypothetical protein
MAAIAHTVGAHVAKRYWALVAMAADGISSGNTPARAMANARPSSISGGASLADWMDISAGLFGTRQ